MGSQVLVFPEVLILVTVTGWYCKKRPMHCDRYLNYCIVSRHLSFNHSQFINNTERRGRVVKTPTSYSGSPGLRSWLRRQTILIEVFCDFSQSLQANARVVP
jgi:hypothetical protein